MYMEVLLWTKHDSWSQHQVGKIYLYRICVCVCVSLLQESLIQCLRQVMSVAAGVPLKNGPPPFARLCRGNYRPFWLRVSLQHE